MRSDELRPQADLAASTKVPELAQGTWIYDGQEHLFLLDAVSFEFFGFAAEAQQGQQGQQGHDPHDQGQSTEHSSVSEWLSEDAVLSRLSWNNKERFYRVMQSRDTGNIIFEDVEMVAGPYKGESFVVQGSVLSRFPDGRVRYATGSLSSIFSSYADFLSHEMAGDSFFSFDPCTNELRFSDSYTYFLGYEEEEMPQTVEELHYLVHPDDREILDIERHILSSPDYGDSFEFCVRMRHKNGHYIWAVGRGLVLSRDERGQALQLIGSFSDINLIQDNFENIKQLLYTDTLTGLKNRSFFQHHMPMWQDLMMRPLSVIYADVTGLKITNDVLGHADGDILLLTVTEVLTTVITRNCDIMRLAGDEFLVIVPRCKAEEIAEIVQQLRDYVQQHNAIPNVMPLFVGFGCATLGEVPHDTLNGCIERADVRMQCSKDEQRQANYTQLKAYLEKRKGRPVSMRDGRRLSYLSNAEREQLRN